MAINARSYSTLQYEVGAVANSATTLVPGTACKITKLPVSPVVTYPDNFYNVAAATAGDQVHGVVSLSGNITDSTNGRLVLLNAAMFPALLGENLVKGDKIKPGTGGKWFKASMGDKAYGELMEAGSTDDKVWVRSIEVTV